MPPTAVCPARANCTCSAPATSRWPPSTCAARTTTPTTSGYANGVLWPVFHYRLDLADFDAGYIDGYRRVNRMFAHKLMPLLQPDDVIWVHDYHLIPLAAELRALGCRQRIGFFLHIPLPPPLILAAIPAARVADARAVRLRPGGPAEPGRHGALRRATCSPKPMPKQLGDGTLRRLQPHAARRRLPDRHRCRRVRRACRRPAMPQTTLDSLREQYRGRQLLVGVDRLDYSKGLPQRIRAFRALLERHPDNCGERDAAPDRRAVSAKTSRPTATSAANWKACAAPSTATSAISTGCRSATCTAPCARKRVPGLYRAARVALVTPLRDGMNLVAKEYIAAQDPDDPGVLVLSRFAGAAEQLERSAAGQPLRHARHRRCDPARAAHAAGRTPRTAPDAAGQHPRAGRALVAREVPGGVDAGAGLIRPPAVRAAAIDRLSTGY